MRYLFTFCLLMSASGWAAQSPTELFWDDLVPKGFEVADEQQVDHQGAGSGTQQSLDAPVVQALNGKSDFVIRLRRVWHK